MSATRILLIDDQQLFREGVRTLLELQADFAVVGEAGDGRAGVEAARHLKPDVVLMDLRMPGVGGVEATRLIKEDNPAAQVLVLTTFEEDEEVFSALRAGATGYLLKAVPAQELYAAVRAASKGQSVLDPAVASKVVAELNRLSKGREVRACPPHGSKDSRRGRQRPCAGWPMG